MDKWKAMLTSRKFWTLVVGTVVSVGLLEFSDNQQATLVEAIIIIVAALGYSGSVAVEDGMTKIAASQEKMAEAQRMTNIQGAISTYNERRAERTAQARKERLAR